MEKKRVAVREYVQIAAGKVLMAGAVIMTLPLLILFLFTQRYFTRGILLGAVKG